MARDKNEFDERFLRRAYGGEFIVDPEQTRSDYPYRVVDTGTEELDTESLPTEKLLEVTKCADHHAEVKLLGDSLTGIL